MIDLIFITCSGIVALALMSWILSLITIPLVKASILIIFIMLIGGIVLVIGLTFWVMGLSAFAILELLLIGIIFKILFFLVFKYAKRWYNKNIVLCDIIGILLCLLRKR